MGLERTAAHHLERRPPTKYDLHALALVGVAAALVFGAVGVASGSLAFGLAASVAFVAAALAYGAYPMRSLSHIPGPAPSLFAGHLSQYDIESAHLHLEELYKQHKPLCRFQLGRTAQVLVTELEDIRRVMSSDFASFHSRPVAGKRRIPFLIDQYGEKWRKSRRTLTPSFNTHNLTQFTGSINATGRELAERLAAIPESESFDVWRYFGEATMQIIASTSFGWEISQADLRSHEIISALQTILGVVDAPLLLRAIPYMQMFPFAHKVLPRFKMIKKSVNTVHKATQEMRKRLEEGDNVTEANKNSFLNLIINARDKKTGDKLDEGEIQSQSFLFIIAGYETTATTFAFLAGEVAKRPDVEAKIVDEIRRVCGSGDGFEISYKQVKDFEYIHWVVKETLRLNPILPLLKRECTEEGVTLSGYDIPRGTNVSIPIYAMQRDPAVWGADAEEFRPERWDPEVEGPHHDKIRFLSFGEGPRKCIGYRFAFESLSIIIAQVYSRLSFHLPKDFEVRQCALLNPRGGMTVQVRPRKHEPKPEPEAETGDDGREDMLRHRVHTRQADEDFLAMSRD